MKRIAIFCDGTWNDPSSNTNVWKTREALATAADDGTPIVWRYNRGVGTGISHKLSGGVFGRGISNNIRELYAAIANIYEPGDELFFFGFSRGAFTARSLAGLITVCGLLKPATPGAGRFDPGSDLVNKAYDAYRDRAEERKAAHEFQRKFAWPVESVSLRFMGVWDTVGSLGIPAIGLRTLIARRLWAFHDTELNCFVREAYQALAIDEHRTPFPATLWQVKSPEEELTPEKAELRRTQHVEQRWFAGSHSEVGGNRGELAWHWMMEKAAAAGLAFAPPLAARPLPERSPALRDSMDFGYQFVGKIERPIGDPVFQFQDIDESVTERAADASKRYEPRNLSRFTAGKPLRRPIIGRYWNTIPFLARLYTRPARN